MSAVSGRSALIIQKVGHLPSGYVPPNVTCALKFWAEPAISLYCDISIIWFSDDKTFTAVTAKDPHNDRLYKPCSYKEEKTSRKKRLRHYRPS